MTDYRIQRVDTADVWTFDVFTATHDDVKAGRPRARWSTVLISRSAYPSDVDAAELAAQLAAGVRRAMPTEVLLVY